VSLPRRSGAHPGAVRIFNHNIKYLAGLAALHAWYIHVRPIFAHDPLSRELISGLRKTLVQSIDERIRQLEKFCDTLKDSQSHDRILATMETVGQHIDQVLDSPKLSASGEKLVLWLNNEITRHDIDYITAIQSLPREIKTQGSHWLLNIETTLLDLLTV